MRNLIKNEWRNHPGAAVERAVILTHTESPEGLDVDRLRFREAGRLEMDPRTGHIMSVLAGNGRLETAGRESAAYSLRPGVHVYLPPGLPTTCHGERGLQLARVSGTSAAQAPGRRLLVRDEQFLAACASASQSLRWVLTPQYLSRRIFLHHDQTLLSGSGNPVSWFHTTMFDVAGLPGNQDGDPVFKMSYNSRTEFNVCYDVKGDARVRVAEHPYSERDQRWGPWLVLDGESTYHVNEPPQASVPGSGPGPEPTGRNKHEVYILGGYVSLFCLFDPAPTGIERHHPGDYSDYEPLDRVVERPEYARFRSEMSQYDEMLDALSLAKAAGDLGSLQGTPVWNRYLQGRSSQLALEAELMRLLESEGGGREQVVSAWRRPRTDER
jgi:hypothetical protein